MIIAIAILWFLIGAGSFGWIFWKNGDDITLGDLAAIFLAGVIGGNCIINNRSSLAGK